MCPRRETISNLQKTRGCFASPAMVVSFNGHSTCGKSFIIRAGKEFMERQHVIDFPSDSELYAMQSRSPFVSEPGELADGSTTGNISVYHAPIGIWVLDSEGTNGTGLPSTMDDTYRSVFGMVQASLPSSDL